MRSITDGPPLGVFISNADANSITPITLSSVDAHFGINSAEISHLEAFLDSVPDTSKYVGSLRRLNYLRGVKSDIEAARMLLRHRARP